MHEPLGMGGVGGQPCAVTVRQDRRGAAVVDIGGRQIAQAAVMVRVVVPSKQDPADAARVFERGELPHLALHDHRPRCAPLVRLPRAVGPLTMMGVERRWFLLSATIGMAMWNAINSVVIGAGTFCVLYGVGWWAWRTDPHMLTILRESVRFKTRYDPAKWAAQPWYVRITQARRRTRSS